MGFIEVLDVEYMHESPVYVDGRIIVRSELLQPFGYVHGGATIALLETVASRGAALACAEGEIPFGVDVHIAHRSHVQEGMISGIARLADEDRTSKGYRRQYWDVQALTEEGRLVSEGRIICLLVPKPTIRTEQ